MKFKLDENLGRRGSELLRAAGHDVMTVADQRLSGAADQKIFDICVNEERALVTLDRDFGHVLRYPPEVTAGIVVLALPAPVTRGKLADCLREFVSMLDRESLTGKLWIVEPGRIRIHLRADDE